MKALTPSHSGGPTHCVARVPVGAPRARRRPAPSCRLLQVLLTLPGGNQNVSLMEATSTLEAATDSISAMPLANITTTDPNVMVRMCCAAVPLFSTAAHHAQ